MFSIKFLSLQKSELEYEVSVRGETPASTVADIRKQISKLSQIYPSEDILCSHLEPADDLSATIELLDKVKLGIASDVKDRSVLSRIENILHHIYHRLNRICVDDVSVQKHLECCTQFKELYEKLSVLKKTSIDTLALTDSTSESQLLKTPINVSVTCDGRSKISSELGRLKFDGKSCVRSFIQRVNEFSEARDISSSKLLSYSTEIFVDDALHWFRSVKEQVSSWDELVVLLKQDFDKSDYDYRLLAEIRSRTQGEAENITIYLSILSGMFSRLSKPLSEEDKLEIILHNIRPCYASTLASVTKIKAIDQLRLLCRNFENIQSRLLQFREPLASTSETLAPEFAYKPKTTSNKQKQFYPDYNNKTTNNHTKPYVNNNVNEKYLHAINKNTANNDRKLPYCPRCRNNTHSLRDCQNTEIMCFKCGRKGVKKPDCPSCNPGSKN